MTKREISEYLGMTNVTVVNAAFKLAEQESESIKLKNGKHNTKVSVDFTLDEFLIACKYLKQMKRCVITPAMQRFVMDNFITREHGVKVSPKKAYLKKFNRFLFLYRNRSNGWKSCITCIYLVPRCFEGTVQKERPFCTFYDCFLHKVKPARDIYFQRCPTFKKSNSEPYLFTEDGAILISKIGKLNTDMAGIPQSEFKSKRAKDEPMYILRDIFEDMP